MNLLAKESYPQLIRNITVDTEKIPEDCTPCEAACPFHLIKISKVGLDGKPVENFEALPPLQKQRVQVKVDIQKEYCPTCRICEFQCPPGLIKVQKTFEGKTAINQEKCPTGCRDCVDVCPIPGALVVGNNGKVDVNELYCTYCGACKVACPVDEALTVKRTKIFHNPVHSGTWNKALGRITSPVDEVKELKATAALKRREALAKRLQQEHRHH